MSKRRRTEPPLIERFAARVDGFNVRPLSLADLYRECERRDILIGETQFRELHGCSFFDEEGVPCITLNTLITEPERVVAGYHELAHILDHVPFPKVCYSTPELWNRSKYERQAQSVGLIALVPVTLLMSLTLEEIAAEYDFPRKLVNERARLWIDGRI